MLVWQIRWKNGGLIKANAVFWVVMLLPVIYAGHFMLGLNIDDLKYEYMYIAVIGMVNALIAGIVVDFWITTGEHKSKRMGTIPLTRIAFKYVVAFVVFVSLVLLSADSRRQLGQMNDAILRDMKYRQLRLFRILMKSMLPPRIWIRIWRVIIIYWV